MKNLNKRAKSGIFQSLISKKSRKGVLALSQIFLLVVSIFAVSWALGSQIGEVDALIQSNYIPSGRITIGPANSEWSYYGDGEWKCWKNCEGISVGDTYNLCGGFYSSTWIERAGLECLESDGITYLVKEGSIADAARQQQTTPATQLEYPTHIEIEGAVWERASDRYFWWYCVGGQCPDAVSGIDFPLHLCIYYDSEELVKAGYTCERGKIVIRYDAPLGVVGDSPIRPPIANNPIRPETKPIAPGGTITSADLYRWGRDAQNAETVLATTPYLSTPITFEGQGDYQYYMSESNNVIRRVNPKTGFVDARIVIQNDGSLQVDALDNYGEYLNPLSVFGFQGPRSYNSNSPLAQAAQAQITQWTADPQRPARDLAAMDTRIRNRINTYLKDEGAKTLEAGYPLGKFSSGSPNHEYFLYTFEDGTREVRRVQVNPDKPNYHYVDAVYRPEGDGYRIYLLDPQTSGYKPIEGKSGYLENTPLANEIKNTIAESPPKSLSRLSSELEEEIEAQRLLAEWQEDIDALEDLDVGFEFDVALEGLTEEQTRDLYNRGRRAFMEQTLIQGKKLAVGTIDADGDYVYDYYLMDDDSIRKVSRNPASPYVTAVYKPNTETEGYDVYTTGGEGEARGAWSEDFYKTSLGTLGERNTDKFKAGINEMNWRNPAQALAVGGVNYRLIGKDNDGNPVYEDPSNKDQYSLGKTDGKLRKFVGELATTAAITTAKAVQSFHWGIPFRAGGFWDSIVGGAKWGLYTKGIFAGAEYFFGSSEFFQKYAPMLEQSAKYGIAVGRAIQIGLTDVSATQTGWLTRLGTKKILTLNNILTPTSAGILWGGLTAAYFFYKNYKTEDTSIIAFSCYTWEPPVGGETCEVCNDKGELPCTEYQCKSLGQACELINQGTGEEKCVWINREDVNAPEIEAWDYVLSEEYVYNPEGVTFPHEADRGVKIEYGTEGDKCIPAFSPLQFGVHVIGGGKDNRPEPAKCKVDSVRKDGFDDMSFYMSNSISKYNHSYFVNLPSLEATEEAGIIIPTGGEFNVYVRCMDSNGNANIGNFVFNFCVEPGPDTTPALIIGNSFVSTTAPIRYGLNETYIQIYLDEPAECKWGHTDQGYNDMAGEMTCQSDVSGVEDLRAVYVCDSTLTGLRNRVDNNFYFRCNDSSGNINKESYKITLAGTQPLVIDHAGPNEETIKDSTDVVQVTLEAITSAGYDEGDATCYYSSTGVESDYISFFYETGTSSYLHTQILWRPGSVDGISHTYYIKCQDGGGNMDNETITFTVQTDLNAPRVVRVYHEEDYLKIITNEPADCVYDVVDCSYVFEDGIIMTSVADTSHFTDWETNTNFYIKCKDEYENQPDPDQCNIIVRPLEL